MQRGWAVENGIGCSLSTVKTQPRDACQVCLISVKRQTLHVPQAKESFLCFNTRNDGRKRVFLDQTEDQKAFPLTF